MDIGILEKSKLAHVSSSAPSCHPSPRTRRCQVRPALHPRATVLHSHLWTLLLPQSLPSHRLQTIICSVFSSSMFDQVSAPSPFSLGPGTPPPAYSPQVRMFKDNSPPTVLLSSQEDKPVLPSPDLGLDMELGQSADTSEAVSHLVKFCSFEDTLLYRSGGVSRANLLVLYRLLRTQ